MTNTKLLKQLLKLQGFTQADIAEFLGITLQAVNMKINNKRYFKLQEITKLCELLKIKNFKDRFEIFFGDIVDCRQHGV